jgi:phosphohistidine phosphatase
MIVYFLRHASAGHHFANPSQDEKRALDEQGIEQCTRIGRALNVLDVHVDAVISSPLKRAMQTASLVANELGFDGKLQRTPTLRPDAQMDSFRELLDRNSRLEAILVVGHNPSLSRFLSLLISEGGTENAADLKKCAVARVDFSNGVGIVKWILTPKIVQAISSASGSSSRPKTVRK